MERKRKRGGGKVEDGKKGVEREKEGKRGRKGEGGGGGK